MVMSVVALKISSTGTLNHLSMLRLTSPKANRNRHTAWNQRQRYQRYDKAGLELGTRLLLFAFDPDFHQIAQQDEAKNQQDEER